MSDAVALRDTNLCACGCYHAPSHPHFGGPAPAAPAALQPPTTIQSIGASDALHNLLRLVEREHQRLEVMCIDALRDRQHIADLEAKVGQLTALVEANEATARTHRGRIDSLEMRMA